MLKRLFLSLAFAGLLSPALASGTIPLSMSQQFDTLGKPLSGCKLYIIQAGTTSTPQNAYQDSALTVAHPNPLSCDSAGRLPQFFLADGSIKVRLADKNGVNQTFPGGGPSGLDNILVIGPSGGGGGGGTVDATTVLATGDLKISYGTSVLAGFVRANGRTIGSATSGATERANADTQALFLYLWANDTNLAVSTGRGVSAASDWAANKTITLPDARGRTIAALDDMGSTAAGRLTSTYFGTSATVLGATGGAQSVTLAATNLAPHQHGGTTAGMNSNQSHSHSVSGGFKGGTTSGLSTGSTNGTVMTATNIVIDPTNIDHTHDFQTTDGIGLNATPFSKMQPTLLATIYVKL